MRTLADVILRAAYAPVATGPCNCCSCRFGHAHPCVSDIGRYPVTTWLALSPSTRAAGRG
jgi:hypothetical protein